MGNACAGGVVDEPPFVLDRPSVVRLGEVGDDESGCPPAQAALSRCERAPTLQQDAAGDGGRRAGGGGTCLLSWESMSPTAAAAAPCAGAPAKS